jgi:hypothetical protein
VPGKWGEKGEEGEIRGRISRGSFSTAADFGPLQNLKNLENVGWG